MVDTNTGSEGFGQEILECNGREQKPRRRKRIGAIDKVKNGETDTRSLTN